MTRYFILASGEHIGLAKAELDALASVFRIAFNWKGRIAEVETETNPITFILNRAALVKEAGELLAESNHIDDTIKSIPIEALHNHLSDNQSFAVRTHSIDGIHTIQSRKQLEIELGSLISKETNARVDLSNPDVTILVILESNRVLVCKSSKSKLREELRKRKPGRKTFFHPSMMNSTLARVMCNLSRVMPGDVVLDPFCGGGGILCEAALIGARCVGSDVNWPLLKGAMTNLDEITANNTLVQGDVRNLPFSSCDALVTDPPYGRASSTRGSQARKLILPLLEKIPDLVSKSGANTCFCGSRTLNIPQLASEAGLKIGRHIEIRVHSGLVRDIVTIVT